MEVITPEIINCFLRAHIDTLSGEELVSLRKTLVSSNKVEQLPVSLRESLRLRDYLLIRNLVEVILGEFDKLIPARCSTGKLVPPQQSQWVKENIREMKTKFLEQWRENDNNNFADNVFNDCQGQDVSPVLLDYTSHLFSKILETWRSDNVKITPKLSNESSLVTLVVEQPVMTLSKCREQVGKWVDILRDHLAQVHFIAKELLYVDCGLDNPTWHGVNILVVAGKMECSTANSKVWDVSGAAGENGGTLLFLCNSFQGLNHLQIITRGGNAFPGESSKPGGNSNLSTLIGLFPPSAHSDSVRQLVFENAISQFGEATLKHFQFKPKDAYDPIEKQVTGQINDFYMEGETDYGVKFYLGFSKTGLFTKNAFCLLQQVGPECREDLKAPGEPGGVRFVSMASLEDLTKEQLGVQVTATRVSGNEILASTNGFMDVGYVALNPKQVIKYPPGKYQIRLDDEEMPDSVNCKLLGKFVQISDKIERVFRCGTKTPSELLKFIEPSTAMEMYALFESETEEKFIESLMSEHEVEWWKSKILNDD